MKLRIKINQDIATSTTSIIPEFPINESYPPDHKGKLIKRDSRIQYLPDDLYDIWNKHHNQGYLFIRFTNHPERGTGINPSYSYDTPLGIYAYPFNPTTIQDILKSKSGFTYGTDYTGMVIFSYNPIDKNKRTIILNKTAENIAYLNDENKEFSFEKDTQKLEQYIKNNFDFDLTSFLFKIKSKNHYMTFNSENKIFDIFDENHINFNPSVFSKISESNNYDYNHYISFFYKDLIINIIYRNIYRNIDENYIQYCVSNRNSSYNDTFKIYELNNKELENEIFKEIKSNFLIEIKNKSFSQSKHNSNFNKIFNFSRIIADFLNKDKTGQYSKKWTSILRNTLGISAILDLKGSKTIHEAEPKQAVFLETTNLNIIYSGENLIEKYKNYISSQENNEEDEYKSSPEFINNLINKFMNKYKNKIKPYKLDIRNIYSGTKNKGFNFIFSFDVLTLEGGIQFSTMGYADIKIFYKPNIPNSKLIDFYKMEIFLNKIFFKFIQHYMEYMNIKELKSNYNVYPDFETLSKLTSSKFAKIYRNSFNELDKKITNPDFIKS